MYIYVNYDIELLRIAKNIERIINTALTVCSLANKLPLVQYYLTFSVYCIRIHVHMYVMNVQEIM